MNSRTNDFGSILCMNYVNKFALIFLLEMQQIKLSTCSEFDACPKHSALRASALDISKFSGFVLFHSQKYMLMAPCMAGPL